MTEGAGFGKNIPTVGVYAQAIAEFYETHPEKLDEDRLVCYELGSAAKLDVSDLEEVFLFSAYARLGYCKFSNFTRRTQLNTGLVDL
jgi:hypothetical protein